MNKIIKEKWQCERRGKNQEVNKILTRKFETCYLHTCECGKLKTLVCKNQLANICKHAYLCNAGYNQKRCVKCDEIVK